MLDLQTDKTNTKIVEAFQEVPFRKKMIHPKRRKKPGQLAGECLNPTKLTGLRREQRSLTSRDWRAMSTMAASDSVSRNLTSQSSNAVIRTPQLMPRRYGATLISTPPPHMLKNTVDELAEDRRRQVLVLALCVMAAREIWI